MKLFVPSMLLILTASICEAATLPTVTFSNQPMTLANLTKIITVLNGAVNEEAFFTITQRNNDQDNFTTIRLILNSRLMNTLPQELDPIIPFRGSRYIDS